MTWKSETKQAIDAGAAVDPALRDDLDRIAYSCLPQIRSVIRRVVHDPSLVDDIAQETLVQAYCKLSTFERNSSLCTWMCGIARFLALNALRKKADLLTADGVVDDWDFSSRTVLQQLTSQERAQVVEAAAAACLDEADREVFELRYIEQLDLDEIEARFDFDTRSGVRGALARIKRRMEKELMRRLAELGHSRSFVLTEAD